MPNIREYMRRIQTVLGETKAANRIGENFPRNEKQSFDVAARELDRCSREYAQELGQESGLARDKATYKLPPDKAPPLRLLSLAIVTSAWLAWIHHEKRSTDP